MKNVILICFLSITSIKSQSQNSMGGTVRDENENPLFGATIYIHEIKSGTTTDINGNFAIQNLPARTLLIEVRYIGYSTVTENVEIKGNATRDFILSQSHIEQKEVIITGLLTDQIRNSPVPIEIIKKDFLFQNGGTNIIEALTKISNVSSMNTGAGISKPVIRGLGYNRVLVVVDGIRQEGQQWGDEHGIEIDEFSIDRVEILKGPASLIYGSDGIAGVVNFETRNPAESGKTILDFTGEYQTNNSLQGYSLLAATNQNGINGFIRGTWKSAGYYHNVYDGAVFNSGFEEVNGNGIIGINKKWGYSHLHFSSFNQTPQLTEGERDISGAFMTDAAPFQKINHNKISLNNNFLIGKSSLKIVLGYQQNQRREFETPNDVALHFDLRTINYDVKYYFPEKNSWNHVIGINGMKQTNTNRGDELLIPDYSLFDYGLFGFSRKSFEKIIVSAGLRYDFRNLFADHVHNEDGSIKFEEVDLNFSNFSGSAGASFIMNDQITIKANLAKGFRAPSMAELSSNGVHEGTFRYEYGNHDLKPENNLQGDLVFELNTNHVSFEACGFYNAVNNFIYIDKLTAAAGGDSVVTDAESGKATAYRFVQNNANLKGGEIKLDIHPHPLDWLHIENSFSCVFGELISGEFLPFIPSPEYNLELKAAFEKFRPSLRNLFVKAELEYHFDQNRVLTANVFETRTPGYTLLHAGLGFDITKKEGNKIVTVIILANNILDTPYQNHLSRLKYAPENYATGRTGIFDMGRNIVFKMNLPLVF